MSNLCGADFPYNFTIPCWKIRRISDGKFSAGGSWPSFTERGKTWWTKGALTSHLSIVKNSRKTERYVGCEVVEYEVLHRATFIQTVNDYVMERKNARENREIERKTRQEATEKRERRKKFFELAEEFGNEL